VLISYIIKGILGHRLPWSLVLLGVMIALVLEMSGVPSLAFRRRHLPAAFVHEPHLGRRDHPVARGRLHPPQARGKEPDRGPAYGRGDDKSPGVLLASGYIAGGALAGIVIALLAGRRHARAHRQLAQRLGHRHNPLFNGPYADALSMIFFLGLCGLLYLVGRETLLGPRKPPG
jgi:hypothetical protein